MRVFSNPGGAYRRGKRARIVSLCPIIVGSWMFSELCRRDAVRRCARRGSIDALLGRRERR